MKIGINLLLWTTKIGEAHYPLLADSKKMGYDGIRRHEGRCHCSRTAQDGQ